MYRYLNDETKVDHPFPDGQFLFDGFRTSFRKNRNRNRGRIMLYIRMIFLQKLFLQMTGLLKVLV